jgi:hypothetical protein
MLATGAVVAGAGIGAAGVASAATSSTSTTTPTSGSSSTTAPSSGAPSTPPSGSAADPATMTHGPGETLLTGTDLEKATAAATAAVSDATVVRAETNSQGDYPYEVHMKKSDGSYVTVELNSSFGVITTISGFGAGPAGAPAPGGPSSSSSSSSTSTSSTTAA